MHLTTAAVQPRADGGRVVYVPPAAPDLTLWLQPVQSRDQARALCLAWLGELAGRPLAASDLLRDAHGKPSLPGSDFAFNVSHSLTGGSDASGDISGSAGWLALVWSRRQARLGVDIECWPRRGDLAALARRYFHPAEIAAWQAAPVPLRDLYWLGLWTRKEAVLKAHGLGLRMTLATLDTTPSPVQHPDTGGWQIDTRLLLPGLVGSIAWPA